MIKKLVWRLLPACLLAGVLLLRVLGVSAQADTPIVDLSEGEEDFRVMGQNAGDWLGEMTTGDINGDGIPDLIVGASGYTVDGMVNAGAVYVIFGSPDLNGTLDLATENADVVFYGYEADGGVGHVVVSGDFDNDGHADIAIGASNLTRHGRAGTGAVYVIYGPIAGTLTAPIYLNDPERVGLTIYGQATGDRFGRAAAVGDVNGDSIDDLIVGAYLADRGSFLETHGSGKVYVFHGNDDLRDTHTIDLSTYAANVTIIGAGEYDRLGRSIAVGDVDGNGVDDLIIGAYYAGAAGSVAGSGEVVLIYGSNTLPATIDLYTNNVIAQELGIRFRGANAGDGFGFYVASGNVNGSRNPATSIGYADILVGAYREGVAYNEDGIGYILYGGPEITARATITSGTWTVPISDCAGFTLNPAHSGDRLGRSVASGDLNADGYDDFVIGASRADPDGRTNAGETYVFYGGSHLLGTITINPTGNTDLTVQGHRVDDEAGRSTAVGDLNGDGVPDLLVGAVLADSQRGEVYAIWGPAAIAISMTASADVVETGDPVTFTVTAINRYAQIWDVTDYATNYAAPPAAGGSWDGNVFTTDVVGTWIIMATHRGFNATTEITVENPTAVTLASFEAAWQDNAVLITWETAMELDNLGFNLYRGSTAAGPWTRLNATLIPPKNPGEVLGALYDWRDDDAIPGVLNFYRLEDVDISGISTFHGPVSVTVPVTVPAQTLYRIYVPLALRH